MTTKKYNLTINYTNNTTEVRTFVFPSAAIAQGLADIVRRKPEVASVEVGEG